MRVAKIGDLLKRGVWVAPFMGANGEIVLVAVSSQRRRVGEIEIPMGANHLDAAEALLELLDDVDPEPGLRLHAG